MIKKPVMIFCYGLIYKKLILLWPKANAEDLKRSFACKIVFRLGGYLSNNLLLKIVAVNKSRNTQSNLFVCLRFCPFKTYISWTVVALISYTTVTFI